MSQASEVTAVAKTESEEMSDDSSGDDSDMEATNEENLDAADDGVAGYAVFVMNLPETATEGDIRKHFEKETTVKSISLFRNAAGKFCGYATVELPDKASFEAAVKLMGSEMNGKSLYVIPHRNIKPYTGKFGSLPYRVVVYNIPLAAVEADVRNHFERKVAVKNVRCFKIHQGEDWEYAVMGLPNKEAYEGALKMMGSKMKGLNLIVIAHKSMLHPDKGKDEARPLKLLVSNIPKSISLLGARRIFFQAGAIKDFNPTLVGKRSGRSKVFESDWSAILTVKTIEIFCNVMKLDGITIKGQAVKVEPLVLDVNGEFKRFAECSEFETNPKFADSEDEDEKENPLKLYIGNLHPSATSDDVLEHFKEAGEIVNCSIPEEEMGYPSEAPYVVMADEEGKEKALALSGTILKGSVLKIEPYMKARGPYGRILVDQDWLQKPNIIIVSNIPPKSTEEDIRQHFQVAGTIESARFPRDLTLALVYLEMKDKESCEKILLMNKSAMGQNCINVIEASSELVPKSWVDLKIQQNIPSAMKRNRIASSLDPELIHQRKELRRQRKEIKKEARKMKKVEKNRRRREVKKLKRNFRRSQNSKQPSAPNTSSGSNYSYSGNTYGRGNSYSSGNNTYSRNPGSQGNRYGSNKSYDSNNYGRNNSSGNRPNNYYGAGSGSSYYQQK